MQKKSNKLQKVMQNLSKVKGLTGFLRLNKEDKENIFKLEEKNNYGVFEALARKHTFACAHDSDFREPASEIVAYRDGKINFPPVPFPEVKEKNAVSSSPGYKVDKYLRDRMKIRNDDATLLIGFD